MAEQLLILGDEMKKDVLVNISGLHMDIDEMGNNDDEAIEVLSSGSYFFKNGKHYILFEEVSEGMQGVTKTQIKLTGTECLEVMKRGVSNMHMILDRTKRTCFYYETPYGQLHLDVYTKDIMVEETEDNINIRVEYVLDVDCQPLAECRIRVNVKPRDSKNFSILEKMEF